MSANMIEDLLNQIAEKDRVINSLQMELKQFKVRLENIVADMEGLTK